MNKYYGVPPEEVVLNWEDMKAPVYPASFWVEFWKELKRELWANGKLEPIEEASKGEIGAPEGAGAQGEGVQQRVLDVVFYCTGGKGRTGTAIACLMVTAAQIDGYRAILKVRKAYKSEAVETQGQVDYIKNLQETLYPQASEEWGKGQGGNGESIPGPSQSHMFNGSTGYNYSQGDYLCRGYGARSPQPTPQVAGQIIVALMETVEGVVKAEWDFKAKEIVIWEDETVQTGPVKAVMCKYNVDGWDIRIKNGKNLKKSSSSSTGSSGSSKESKDKEEDTLTNSHTGKRTTGEFKSVGSSGYLSSISGVQSKGQKLLPFKQQSVIGGPREQKIKRVAGVLAICRHELMQIPNVDWVGQGYGDIPTLRLGTYHKHYDSMKIINAATAIIAKYGYDIVGDEGVNLEVTRG